MSNNLLFSLVFLLISLFLFQFVQRKVHRELQAIFLLLTRRQDITIVLFSLIFFPGVLLHELSHYIMARLLRVKTGSLSLIPRVVENRTIRMGYVETARTGTIRSALIGIAPLLSGGAAVTYIGLNRFGLTAMVGLASSGAWNTFFETLIRFPEIQDFWVWFYLIFTISSTLLPSPADRQAWLPLIIGTGILAFIGMIAGAGPWMVINLGPIIITTIQAAAIIFSISLLLHLTMVIPLTFIHWIISKISGISVK
jgi:hypothetical protein